MKIGKEQFDIGKKVYVMGILNVTPDSFSDGGNFNSVSNAMRQAGKMVEEGASIIDVGGESTRPGHVPITEKEEIERVIPVIVQLKKKFDIPVSIDTYKSRVAEAALEAGADMINDIWGFQRDVRMAELAVQYRVPVCLMHNREEAVYQDFMSDVISDLQKSLRIAKEAGVKDSQIILDPGVGFAKNYEENLEVIRHVDEIVKMGYPVLMAASRKRVVGTALGEVPVGEREEGTIAISVISAMKGCSFVRVHDVKKNIRGLRMYEALFGGDGGNNGQD